MSGPVSDPASEPTDVVDDDRPLALEVTESKEVLVGSMRVRRALPRRGRRTIGAWCFADHMGPAEVTERSGLDIGAHPHIGLQTVTWLLDGQALHRDSLGSEQVISPGQLNLMTAGNGVSHSEEATGHYSGTLEGIQLWIAQPERTRFGPPAFEHHAELPQLELPNGSATVVIGDFAGLQSSARPQTPLMGAELRLRGPVTMPLNPDWEYGLIVLRGAAGVSDQLVEPGRLAFLGSGRDELELDAPTPTVALLLGGEPFNERLMMWWNFVARSEDELNAAYRSWHDEAERFGVVRSDLPRIPAPAPYWAVREVRE